MSKQHSDNPTNSIMEKLLASQTQKIISLSRGQQVEGEIVAITDKEVILDLGAKSEGVLQKRELNTQDLKIADKLKVFVVVSENESGQVVVSMTHQVKQVIVGGRGSKGLAWNKFIQAQSQKSRLQGVVLEVNKGGLIVEVDGVRGFLPNSQVGFEMLSKSGAGPLRQSSSEARMESLIGQTLNLTVIEVDSNNNKLIFTQRGQVSEEVLQKLKAFVIGTKTKGKVVAILPFGLVVDVSSVEGLVFISDVSWEKVDDLSKIYQVGQELEVVVTGSEEELGRLNLSVKQLFDDPFSKTAEKYAPDETVKGEITGISEAGVSIKLGEGVEGLLSAAKMDPATKYEVGQTITALVDNVDGKRRRINLAPFITSTEGLIYK